jgi:hypothetical protein
MKGKVFTAQEVQAMLNGSKVMFREVIKPQPIGEFIENESWSRSIAASCGVRNPANSDSEEHAKKCSNIFSFRRENGLIVGKLAPYQVGQKIFCKESFNLFAGQVYYKQGLVGVDRYFWKPAQHMKQEHSRLFPVIKEIRVERLADISPFDCVCEGVWDGRNVMLGMSGKAVEAFKDNWNATHKKPEEKFQANPWVFVYTMEVVK